MIADLFGGKAQSPEGAGRWLAGDTPVDTEGQSKVLKVISYAFRFAPKLNNPFNNCKINIGIDRQILINVHSFCYERWLCQKN